MFNTVHQDGRNAIAGMANVMHIAIVADISTFSLGEKKNQYSLVAIPQTNEAALPLTGTGAQVGDYNYAIAENTFWKVVGSIGNHVQIFGDNSAVEDIVMQAGKTFSKLEAQYRSNKHEGDGSKEFGVTGKDVKHPFKVVGMFEDNIATLDEMVGRPLIIHVKTNNGDMIQYGEPDAPAYILSDKEESGEVANQFIGSSYSIACHTRTFYRGSQSGLYS